MLGLLCALCTALLAAGACAETLPALGMSLQTQADLPDLAGARRLQLLDDQGQELSPNDTDDGAYLLNEGGATLTLTPEQTADLATLDGESMELAADGEGALVIAPAEVPLRLTLTAPEQEEQSWLMLSTQEQVAALCGELGCSWQFAPVDYLVRFVDAEGNPVPQVFTNVCTDTLCTAYFSDANGEVRFSGAEADYVLHVLQVPEGYAFDATKEIPLPAGEDGVTVTLEKE